jgi:hypothetical protein
VRSDLGKFLTRFLDLRNFTHPSTTSAFTTWYSLHTTNSMHCTRNICVLNAHSSRSATAIIQDAIAFSLQCQVELNICNGRTIHLAAINQRHHRPPPFILSPSGYVHTPASSVSSLHLRLRLKCSPYPKTTVFEILLIPGLCTCPRIICIISIFDSASSGRRI